MLHNWDFDYSSSYDKILSILQHEHINRFNSSHSDPGRIENINLNFYFHTSLWRRERFHEGLQMHEAGTVKRFIHLYVK